MWNINIKIPYQFYLDEHDIFIDDSYVASHLIAI